MLIEQDDLAESWNGPGASAAADRVVNEKTAGTHICAKIDDIKDLLASGQTELQDAKNFVSAKRASIIGLGFEVDDRGIVSASEKIKQLNQAGGERADVMAAGLAVMAEAGRYTTEMLQSLQHAKGVADSVQTRLTTLNSELSTLMIKKLLRRPSAPADLSPACRRTPLFLPTSDRLERFKACRKVSQSRTRLRTVKRPRSPRIPTGHGRSRSHSRVQTDQRPQRPASTARRRQRP